jgi:hypothetical protein
MTTLNTPGEKALRLECGGKSFVVCGANFAMLYPKSAKHLMDN